METSAEQIHEQILRAAWNIPDSLVNQLMLAGIGVGEICGKTLYTALGQRKNAYAIKSGNKFNEKCLAATPCYVDGFFVDRKLEYSTSMMYLYSPGKTGARAKRHKEIRPIWCVLMARYGKFTRTNSNWTNVHCKRGGLQIQRSLPWSHFGEMRIRKTVGQLVDKIRRRYARLGIQRAKEQRKDTATRI